MRGLLEACGGSLAELWDSTKIHFSPIGKDLHTLHGVVQVLSNNFSFVFSGIYASKKFKRRKFTWSELEDMVEEIDLP